MKPTLPLEGGCRCGGVRLKVTAEPILTMACHCTGCQKMSASAYSLSALFPAEGFAVLAGEPVLGGLRGGTRHFFCPDCLSWLFTRPEGMEDFVNLRATTLDETSWFSPYMETYTSEKLAFAETGARVSFPQFPAEADFPRLVQGYRAEA